MAWVSWPTQGDIEGVLIEDEPQGGKYAGVYYRC